jgi:hypothetical protein
MTRVVPPPTVVTPSPALSPARRSALLIGGGAVLVLGTSFMLGRASGSEAGNQVAVTPPVRHDSVAVTAPIVVPPPAATTQPAVPQDSSVRKAAEAKVVSHDSANRVNRARTARRDSLARLASAVPAPVRKPIAAFARAIASGDVVQLRAAYPGMSSDQEKRWNEGFFKLAENIKVKPVQYGASKVNGATATVDFTVPVDYVFRSSKTSNFSSYHYHATLEKQGKAWQITSMTSR